MMEGFVNRDRKSSANYGNRFKKSMGLLESLTTTLSKKVP
jgi:hypothetical protein